MFSEVTDVRALLKMMNIAVANTVATVVHSADRKVNNMIGSDAQRLNTDSRTMKIMMKFKHAPVRKRPNIQ